jgi:hypothetical protein
MLTPKAPTWPFLLDVVDNPNAESMNDLNMSEEDTTRQGWST